MAGLVSARDPNSHRLKLRVPKPLPEGGRFHRFESDPIRVCTLVELGHPDSNGPLPHHTLAKLVKLLAIRGNGPWQEDQHGESSQDGRSREIRKGPAVVDSTLKISMEVAAVGLYVDPLQTLGSRVVCGRREQVGYFGRRQAIRWDRDNVPAGCQVLPGGTLDD